MRRILHLLYLLAVISSCSPEKPYSPVESNQSPNWINYASAEKDLSLFSTAVIKSGLNSQLTGEKYTVLAPVDDAMQKYLDDLGAGDIDSWLNLYGGEIVRKILLYHFITGPPISAEKFGSSFVATSAKNRFGNYLSLRTYRQDTIVKLNGMARLVEWNLAAGHSLIHKMDQVLNLPTLPSILNCGPEFSILKRSMQDASGNLEVLLRQENEKYTFFAPTDQAFLAFFDASQGINNYQDFRQSYTAAELENTLRYHLLGNVYRLENLTDGSYPTLLPGRHLKLAKDSHGSIILTDSLGNIAHMTIGNIHVLNGVMHSINYVLQAQ